MPTTEAWVIHRGSKDCNAPAELCREPFCFDEITDEEALVDPIVGSWEANMSHAVARQPVDVCAQRREEKVVIGNAGVVRIATVGTSVTTVRPGQTCLFFGTGTYDGFGYMERAHAFDAPHTVGLLAKQTKVRAKNLLPLPANTRFSCAQWAAFAVRYMTAWSNWRVAYGCLRLQLDESDLPRPYVWGWGGGTTLAELTLAKRFNCATSMITGHRGHEQEIISMRIEPIDRREFPNLNFDEQRYAQDAAYKRAYDDSERRFLEIVNQRTAGMGVSIFVDYIGTPVLRPTLRALGRQGVITTAGWKAGMRTSSVRAIECIRRHIHVHTHYARYSEGMQAMQYAEEHGWMPEVSVVYEWDDVPTLARDFAAGKIDSYFPVFRVNGE